MNSKNKSKEYMYTCNSVKENKGTTIQVRKDFNKYRYERYIVAMSGGASSGKYSHSIILMGVILATLIKYNNYSFTSIFSF